MDGHRNGRLSLSDFCEESAQREKNWSVRGGKGGAENSLPSPILDRSIRREERILSAVELHSADKKAAALANTNTAVDGCVVKWDLERENEREREGAGTAQPDLCIA